MKAVRILLTDNFDKLTQTDQTSEHLIWILGVYGATLVWKLMENMLY